jgi:hypothetical protein
MGRIVELILLGFLLWLAYEGLKARVRAFFSGGSPAPRSPRQPAGKPGETLVRCAQCGTHVVQSRALSIRDRDDFYCSERCQSAAARQNRS